MTGKAIHFCLIVLAVSAFGQTGQRSREPLVLIRGNGNVSVNALGIGTGSIVAGSSSVSKHDQTIEMAKQLMKHCPEITLTLKPSEPIPDYALVLNREGAGVSQFMLLRASDQVVLYASYKGTVAKAMQEGCKVLLGDWHRQHTSASQ